MQHELKVTLIGAALAVGAALCGCSAVVGDYEIVECSVEAPTTCAQVGEDAETQLVGCCNANADKVYWCRDGQLQSLSCDEGTCDYDPDNDGMACVE